MPPPFPSIAYLSHQANLLARNHEVVRDLVRNHRVLPVAGVARHEVTEPRRCSHDLSRSALPQVLKVPGETRQGTRTTEKTQ